MLSKGGQRFTPLISKTIILDIQCSFITMVKLNKDTLIKIIDPSY